MRLQSFCETRRYRLNECLSMIRSIRCTVPWILRTQQSLSTTVNSPKPPPSDPAFKELVNQVNALSSLIRSTPANPQTVPTAMIPILASRPDHVSCCIWCDSPDHSNRILFAEALETGNIRINEVGHVVLSSTNAEIPPAFGRGGMKLLYDTVCPPPAPSRGLLHMYAYDDRISA
jgi:hypothetical protein